MSCMKTYRVESARAGLDALSRAGLDYDEFVNTAIELIELAVPWDGICVGTMDPATVMMTRAFKIDVTHDPGADLEFLRHEYALDDFAQFADLARRDVGVSILRTETDGDPQRSARFTEVIRPLLGAEHELRGVARVDGATWGALSIYRVGGSGGAGGFTPEEADFIHSIAKFFAVGLRAGLVTRAAETALVRDQGPAVLMFSREGLLIHATSSAERRIIELGGNLWNDPLAAVTALVTHVAHAGGSAVVSPRIPLRSSSGEWLVLHAAPFHGRDGDSGTVVVTIENATPPEVMPLIMAAYGLTDRESAIVLAVLRGSSTQEIAQRMYLSPYTVQDHLKSVFEKLGVSSRREVVAKVFYDHYLDSRDGELTTRGGFAHVSEASSVVQPVTG